MCRASAALRAATSQSWSAERARPLASILEGPANEVALARGMEDAGTGDIGMSEREEYLGDGLYASFDGYQIRFRAPRGFGVDHEVFLDQTTLQASSAPVRPGES